MIPTELQSVIIKIALLDRIIQEARQAGDERWVEPARQARILNERRVELLREERARQGLEQPEPIRIQAKVCRMGAKGEKP